MEKLKESFTRYEKTRILGARALQIAMDAPILLKISKEELEVMRYDPLRIAEAEFDSNVLPITVKRPMPMKIEEKLKKIFSSSGKKEGEEEDEDIEKEGEIMELSQPEDEVESEATSEEEAVSVE